MKEHFHGVPTVDSRRFCSYYSVIAAGCSVAQTRFSHDSVGCECGFLVTVVTMQPDYGQVSS